VVFHRLEGGGAGVEEDAAAAKSAAEALQAQRAAGAMAEPNGRVTLLHERLEAVLAADGGA
jgi:hypothetical protein